MYSDLVNCNNCGAMNIIIQTGGIVCPRCSSIGCLTWSNDKQEVESDVCEEVTIHKYEPTDSQGHSMECSNCGHFTTVWDESEDDKNKEFVDSASYEDLYAELSDIYGQFDSFIYKIKGSPTLYIETCKK